jgi:hypothetical protein
MSLDPKDRRPARDAHPRRERRARPSGQAFPDADANASRYGVGEIEIRPHTRRALRREGDASAGLSHATSTSPALPRRHGASARARDSGVRYTAPHSSADGDRSAPALADARCYRPESRRGDRCAAIHRNRTSDAHPAADGHGDRDGLALSRSHGDCAKTVAAAELDPLHTAVAAAQFHALHAAAVAHTRDRAPDSDAQARRLL